MQCLEKFGRKWKSYHYVPSAYFAECGIQHEADFIFIYFQAEEAGKISMRQYKLSKMLGDESLAARSRLYSAIAYSQKGHLKLSRHIVRHIAAFARQTHDVRLNRMCQGVWVKLKYLQGERNLYLDNCKLKVNTK